MSAKLWEGCFTSYRTASDQIASGALAYFYAAGTTTPLTVFSNDTLSTPHAQPIVANASGFFAAIYLPYTDYRVLITDASGITIRDFDGITNAAPPASGGGAGVVVLASQLPQTGDYAFTVATGAREGYVRANGRTIGNAASNALERANADCAALFTFIYDKYPSSECIVSGGRSGSPSSDFAANKTISLPDDKGNAFIGSDSMGGFAATRTQTITNLSTSVGSQSATVLNIAGLCVGMFIVSDNLPAGTTIAALPASGAVITVSQAATVTGTVASRFSFIQDAELAGSRGGSATHGLITSEAPSHSHTGDVTSTAFPTLSGAVSGTCTISDLFNPTGQSIAYVVGANNVTFAITTPVSTPNSGALVGTASVSGLVTSYGALGITATGGGYRHNNMQPSRVVTVYLKL